MAKPTLAGKLGFFYDGGSGDRWVHNGDDWVEFHDNGSLGYTAANVTENEVENGLVLKTSVGLERSLVDPGWGKRLRASFQSRR